MSLQRKHDWRSHTKHCVNISECEVFRYFLVFRIKAKSHKSPEAQLEPPQNSKMKGFGTIVNGWKLLVIVAKLSILDVSRCLGKQ